MWDFCSSCTTGNHTGMRTQQEHTTECSHSLGMPAGASHIKVHGEWSGQPQEVGCGHPIVVISCLSSTTSSQCLLERNKGFFCAECFLKVHTDTAVKCLDPLQWGNIPVHNSNLRWQMVSPGCPQNVVLIVSSGCSFLKTNKLKEIALILNYWPEKHILNPQAAIAISTCRNWP